jgi:DNA-binding LacI/PurR family transcriptional regulator/anti-anti-sigma regulatory factor
MSHRRAIGLITSFVAGRFFEQVINGLQTVAWQNQVDVLVIHGTPEQAALTQVGEQRVDGWLVLSYTQGLDLLAQQGKPIVTISAHLADQKFPAVHPDNRQGVETLMAHLMAEGHRRIAFVGDTSIGDIQERYGAYLAMLSHHEIPFDSNLVVITDNPLADRGVTAARKLLAAKVDCTAIIAGNDWTAIGLMREYEAHGLRIPEDIAIVGFDDIPEAQVTNPPLTTIRQRTDELGSTATRMLLAQISGEGIEPKTYYIPTDFVMRESSSTRLMTPAPSVPETATPEEPASWRTTLANDLVRVLLPALPLDPPPSPAQVWPEVDKLVRLLEAIINGNTFETSDFQLLQSVFSSPPILNANPEILVEMVRVLESAGLARLGEEAAGTREQLRALLDRVLVEVMRTYRRRQNSSRRTLGEALQSQYAISQILPQLPPQQLDWLKQTPMYAGCLGLWTPAGNDQPPTISLAGCYQRDGESALRPGLNFSAAQFPPLDLLPSTSQPNGINTCLVLTVRTMDHDWGMLAISGPLISNDPWLGDNAINTLEISCSLLGLSLEREALLESLRHSSEHEERLANHVRELSCPVVPVMDEVVLLPMAGVVDLEQASQMMLNALKSEQVQQASDVFLDLSGVHLIDNEVADLLIEITGTIRRMRARATVIGITPEVQRQIFGSGGHLAYLSSQPTLAAAIEQVKRARQGGDAELRRPLAI